VNDVATVDYGVRESVAQPTVSDDNLQLLGILDDGNTTNGVNFTIAEGSSGDAQIEISQTALIAVADAFYVEILDAEGNSVYVATASDDPLIGDAAGIHFLGATGDNTLVADVSGLEPGDYTVVVRKGESALGTLLDTDGDGVSLSELGQGGVVLGAENQDLILDAVEDTLNDDADVLNLGTIVRGILEPVLNVTTEIGAGQLVEIVSDALNALGLSQAVDTVLGALADALLSNTLTLIQDTSITVDVTEHSFADATTPISGNVIDPDSGAVGEAGEDTVTEGTVVSEVSDGSGEPVVVGAEGATIEGQFGTLVIDADGNYTYTPNGDIDAIGQSEVFTYTLSDGTTTSQATLTIDIDGDRLTDDIAQAGIEYDYVTEEGTPIPDAVDYSWTAIVAGVPIGANGSLTSDSFVVAEDTTQTLTLNIDVGSVLAVGSGTTVVLEVLEGGTWTEYATFDSGSLLSLLGSGGSGEVIVPDVPAGEYRLNAELDFSLASVAGGVSVDIGSEITHLDQFEQNTTFEAHGDLFANDLLLGDEPTSLAISTDGVTFQDVPDGSSLTIEGSYGSLLLNADGTYTYTPDGRADFGMSTDTFEYQAEISGVVHTATLTVNIDGTLDGGGVPPQAETVEAASFGDEDVVPLSLFSVSEADDSGVQSEDHSAISSYNEPQDDLDIVLHDVVDGGDGSEQTILADDEGDQAVDTSDDASFEDADAADSMDPLAYLSTQTDEDLNGHHAVM